VNPHCTDFSFTEFRHTTFRQPFGTVFSLSYSPDGESIAVGDDNGEIACFFAANGQLQMSCVGHSDVVSAVTFSPDGKPWRAPATTTRSASGSARDGRCTNILVGHEGWVYSLAFSP